MATVLSVGDIAIVQYNSSTTDSFTFVFTRDVEAGTVVNFTDNGWLAAGGFRAGEGTLTYTAAAAVTAGTIVTLTGLNLDDAGDQIIAYQGDPATPTILHVVDLADGNNTVAGDATNDKHHRLAARLNARRQRGRGRLRQCDLRRTEQRIARRVVPRRQQLGQLDQ